MRTGDQAFKGDMATIEYRLATSKCDMRLSMFDANRRLLRALLDAESRKRPSADIVYVVFQDLFASKIQFQENEKLMKEHVLWRQRRAQQDETYQQLNQKFDVLLKEKEELRRGNEDLEAMREDFKMENRSLHNELIKLKI